MTVTIRQLSKSTMQSGRGKLGAWVLECDLETPRKPDKLMGWSSSADTNNQIRLTFDSFEDACEFAKSKGWDATIVSPHQRIVVPRNYGDNFKYLPPAEKS